MSAVKDAAGEATGKAKDTAEGAKDTAGKATSGASGLVGSVVGQFTEAMREALTPVIKEMSDQAAQQAASFAKEQGPQMLKETVVPKVTEAVGVDDVSDLPKAAVGKVGEAISGSGGITGIAGKLMSKVGGKKGGKGAAATGYGQGRRIMVQQHQYVPVNYKDAFRAWTESEWPEYMHRVNTLDRQIDEDEARYAIGIKGFWFKKNFTARIQEQVPFKHIVWVTTQGNIKNTGRVSFFEVGEDLTLMILNLDMAPSGLKEKWVRGFRYHKRGIRSDFHRFAAWIQMRTPDQLLDMEGWLGTVEGGKITQSHDEYVDEHEEEQDRAEKAEQEAQDPMKDEYLPEDEQRDEDEDEESDEEERDEEEEQDDEPEADEDDDFEDEEDEPDDEEDEEDEEPARASRRSADEEDDEDDFEDDEEDEEEPEPEPKPRRKSTRARSSRQRAAARR